MGFNSKKKSCKRSTKKSRRKKSCKRSKKSRRKKSCKRSKKSRRKSRRKRSKKSRRKSHRRKSHRHKKCRCKRSHGKKCHCKNVGRTRKKLSRRKSVGRRRVFRSDSDDDPEEYIRNLYKLIDLVATPVRSGDPHAEFRNRLEREHPSYERWEDLLKEETPRFSEAIIREGVAIAVKALRAKNNPPSPPPPQLSLYSPSNPPPSAVGLTILTDE